MIILCNRLSTIGQRLGNNVHPYKLVCVMSAYLPSIRVSDGPEDRYCLLCLTMIAGTLAVMTKNPWLSMGSRVTNTCRTRRLIVSLETRPSAIGTTPSQYNKSHSYVKASPAKREGNQESTGSISSQDRNSKNLLFQTTAFDHVSQLQLGHLLTSPSSSTFSPH